MSDRNDETKQATGIPPDDDPALADTMATPPSGSAIDGTADTVSETPPGETDAPAQACGGDDSTDAPADPTDAMVGRCLADRYLIQKRLGKGGMGLVYLARHQALDKLVAVKLIHSEMAGNQLNLVRFEREAKAAAALDHEYVVDVIDYGHTEDGLAFMVMEYLEGRTVDELIEEVGPLPPGRATAIAWQIAKGLKVAHRAGLIHRDLKSPNVFLIDREGRDSVKLLDFGISKMREVDGEDDVKLTSTGVVMGTPNYLSPEQAKGDQELDHRVDIYSLGVIFYEMLTGRLPFIGSNVLELAYKHISVEPEPPSQVRPDLDIPPELDAIVLKCLAKDPADRYQTAPELIEALPDPAKLTGGWTLLSFTPQTSPPGSLAAGPPPPKTWRRLVLLSLGLGAVIGGSLVAFFAFRNPPPAGDRDELGPAAVVSSPDRDAALTDGGTKTTAIDAESVAADAAPTKSVFLLLRPRPPEAAVYLDGVLQGHGELILELQAGGDPVTVQVKAAGYRPETREIHPASNETIVIELDRLGQRPHPHRDHPEDRPEKQPPISPPTGPSPPDVKTNPYGR